MTLSKETINELAFALKDDVVQSIHESQDYVDFMQQVIPKIITEKMGQVDPQVLHEISMSVMDHIDLY